MNNKTLLLTLSFTLGTLFTNAQLPLRIPMGRRMGTPDLSWTAQVGAKTYPEGKIFQAADYGLKNDSTQLKHCRPAESYLTNATVPEEDKWK